MILLLPFLFLLSAQTASSGIAQLLCIYLSCKSLTLGFSSDQSRNLANTLSGLYVNNPFFFGEFNNSDLTVKQSS